MRGRLLYILLFCLSALSAFAWKPWPLPMDKPDTGADTLHYGVGVSAVASGGGSAPLWLHANTWGDISTEPFSGNISAFVMKPATRHRRWWDYSFGVQLNGRIDNVRGTSYFQQLYAHCRLYIFDITAGIKPMNTTYGDASLSTGSLLFSNNAHPLPRISIGIDKWTSFPFTYGYLEIKGGLTHAWMTDALSGYYLHHKYIGGRLGGKLPIHLSYEFHHAAQWGGTSPIWGNLGNDWKSFGRIFTARAGGMSTIEANNAQGNHLAMQQLALYLNLGLAHVAAYWQVVQEDGPIKFMGTTMNKHDGLWGVQIWQHHFPYVQRLCYEFINTTDQSGPVHEIDGFIFGGRDDYYNHAIYSHGWTYFGRTIGNPLMSPTDNRIRAHHVAIKGDIKSFYYRLMCTYIMHYTPYAEDLPLNASRQIKSRQTSLMLEVEKTIPQAWNLTFSLVLGADISPENGNTFGGRLTIRKSFDYILKK